MKHIELLGLIQDGKRVIDYLQSIGVVELTDYREHNSLNKLQTSSSVAAFEQSLRAAQASYAVLNQYYPKKHGVLDMLKGKKDLPEDSFRKKSGQADEILAKCEEISSLNAQIYAIGSEIAQSQAKQRALMPWLDLDIPFGHKGTAKTAVFIGSFPSLYDTASLLEKLRQFVPDDKGFTADVFFSSKDISCAAVISHKDDSDAVVNALRSLGFILQSDEESGLPAEKYEQLSKDIELLNKKRESFTEAFKEYERLHDDIEFLIDYYTMQIDKYKNIEKLALSRNVFVLTGYVPVDNLAFIEKIEKKFTVAVTVTDPGAEDAPPVLLKNNPFAAGVESVTAMYSLPGKSDVDPNPVLSFFYYALFGIMLSDAGYGLLMVIAMLITKKKFKLEGNMRKTVDMFFYCGISTVFWGAMFGSWFGDIVQVIGKQFFNTTIPSLALWFEPIVDPLKMLLYSFLFGIIHLFAGLGVRFYMLWKDGKKLDAVFDVIPVYLLIAGVAPIGVSVIQEVPAALLNAGKYLALAGMVSVVLTSGRSAKNIIAKLGGGLYGLYNIGAGYLGDILSYSRLLALGLSTGVVASVVNMLGTIPQNKVVKGIVIIVVFVVGQAVNFAINLIGAYVHTNRLQYVEFFSKFYEGGGRAFTPLKANTKYFKIREETANG